VGFLSKEIPLFLFGAMDENIKELQTLVETLLQEEGVELVEMMLQRSSRGLTLRVLVDKDEGITIDTCARLNRKIGEALEKEDCIKESYTLEVSSPGLDRVLKETRDFERAVGRTIKIWPLRKGAPGEPFTGTLLTVDEQGIIMRIDTQTLRVGFSDIFKAKQAIQF